MQYYTARLVAGQIQSGEEYNVLPQSITIAIADFRLWPKSGRCHRRFCLYAPEAGIQYPNSMEIHTLELPKIPEDGDGSKLWEWLRFLSSETKNEFELLAGKDTVMAEAYGRLVELSQDEKARLRALAHEKFVRDNANRMNGARREGEAKGLAKGLRKGRAEARAEGDARVRRIARHMLLRHTPVEEIAEVTGLTKAAIRRLKAKP